MRGRGRTQVQTGSKSPPLFLVHALWVLLVYEVDVFLTAKTGAPFNRLPTVLAPILLFVTLFHGKRKTIYWPLVLFLAMHLGASLFAENAGISRVPFKYMFYVVLLLASTATFVDTPPKMSFLLKLYMVGFAWFGLQGVPTGGRVLWHPLMGNEDSFGPLMVIAIPIAFFYAQATQSRRWRWIAKGIFGVGVLGLMVSFARGAALAGAAVLLHILLFSPNKTRTFTSLMLATIVLVPLVVYFVPLDAYFKEVGSSAAGDEVRTHLWGLAWRVFKTSPLVGVGAGNFGVIGEVIATPADHRMVWGAIYYRAVHNVGMQILAEEGLVGIALWATMIVGFFRWNKRLRVKDAVASWRTQGGTDFNLSVFTRGLDGAMLGFLLTSIFYNELYVYWFWSLLILSFVLHRMVIVMPSSRARRMPRGHGPVVPSLQRTG
jgi:O-antigen ligase